MGSVKFKICGIRRPQDAEYVNAVQADYAGFVFYPPSSRAVSRETAAVLRKRLLPSVKAVGVFVNAEEDFIAELAEKRIIDFIQLHGDETAAYCSSVRERTGLPVIRAVRVRDENSLDNLAGYPCDYFLFDTYKKDKYGGVGRRFDLKLLENRLENLGRPYFIAGGIDAANVAEIIRKAAPYGVDVSGGVETDGVKDPDKIAAFAAEVRREEHD